MYIHTIDIAHPPLSSEEAERRLDEEMRSVRNHKEWQVLKVVHGYGSGSGKSILKDVVKNWAYRNKKFIEHVIQGENYNIFDEKTMEMRKTLGQVPDPDMGTGNPGITLIWIK